MSAAIFAVAPSLNTCLRTRPPRIGEKSGRGGADGSGQAVEIGAQLAALSEAIGEAGADVQHKDLPLGVKAVTLNQWREKAYARGVSDGDADAKRKAFKRAFDALNADQFIGVADPYVWIAD